jgi:hypothetical protein
MSCGERRYHRRTQLVKDMVLVPFQVSDTTWGSFGFSIVWEHNGSIFFLANDNNRWE